MSGLVDMAQGLKVDDQGRLDQDLFCAGCGYNLRTIPLEGICPECGLKVADSLDPQRLCFANSLWIKKLIRGLTLVLLCPVIYLVVGFSLTLIDNNRAVSVVLYVTLCLLFGLHFVGYWFFTTRPQPWVEGIVSDTRRWVARGILIAVTVVRAVFSTLGQFGNVDGNDGMILIGVTGIVFVFAMLRYAGKLAMCIPDRGLAKMALVMIWLWIGSILTTFPLIYINVSLAYQSSSSWRVIVENVAKVTVICFYLVILAGLVLMFIYRRRLVKVYKGME